MLETYNSKPTQWQCKNAAIFLVTSLESRGQTQKFGVTQISNLVNLNEFAVLNILPELQKPNGNVKISLFIAVIAVIYFNFDCFVLQWMKYPLLKPIALDTWWRFEIFFHKKWSLVRYLYLHSTYLPTVKLCIRTLLLVLKKFYSFAIQPLENQCE